MRRLAIVIAAIACTWALPGLAAEEKILNVFTWPDYIGNFLFNTYVCIVCGAVCVCVCVCV